MAFTTITGSNGRADSFIGTSGVDRVTLGVIRNGAFLSARQADDVVRLNSGGTGALASFSLNGGAGADTFTSLSSTNISRSRLLSDEGNDEISLTGVDASTVSGGTGNDQISTAGSVASALINGNAGIDQISINAGAVSSSIFGGIGDDTLALSTEIRRTVVQANEGDDVLTVANGTFLENATINGNQGNDAITVNAISQFATSTLFGGDGNDTVNASNSAVGVVISGDAGNDILTGGTGRDSVGGGDGNDIITGGAAADTLTGGAGNNQFSFNTNDVAQGETITLTGTTNTFNVLTSTDFGAMNGGGATTGLGSINIASGQIAQFLSAQLTGATLTVDGVAAGGQTEILTVNASNNAGVSINLANATLNNAVSAINGGNGNDNITGTNANDTITGAAGADNMAGGAGNNVFLFNTNDVVAGEQVQFTGGSTNAFNVNTTTVFDDMNGGNAINGLGAINLESGQSAQFRSEQLTGATLTVNGVAAGGQTEILTVNASTNTGVSIDLAHATLNNAVSAINGGNGNDTIFDVNGDSTINGGAGADLMFSTPGGLKIFGTANNFGTSGTSIRMDALFGGSTISNSSIFGFNGGLDRIIGFNNLTGIFDVATPGFIAAPTSLFGLNALSTTLADQTTYIIYGDYDEISQGFAVDNNGIWQNNSSDALIVVGDGSSTSFNITGFQMISNLSAAINPQNFI